MEKITKREMFEAIKRAAESGALNMEEFGDGITDEAVADFCLNEIDLLDKKAAKAKERAAAKAAEGDVLTDLIRDALSTDEFKSIADVTAMIVESEPEATAAKVSYRLSQLVKNGEAEKSDITIAATETSKKRTVNGYRKIGL